MLVLTRRVGESIIIGGDVRITVLGVLGGKVRIGADAPLDVSVNRSEVHEKKPSADLPPDHDWDQRRSVVGRRRRTEFV